MKAYRIEPARVDPLVTLIANDNWVELTMRYVVHHRERGSRKTSCSRVLKAVDDSEGRVGLASMTVQLVEAPPLDVRLSRRAASGKE
ncbi:MAG: hypothetical protein R3B70_12385 [Polyangiaceae bacterium]